VLRAVSKRSLRKSWAKAVTQQGELAVEKQGSGSQQNAKFRRKKLVTAKKLLKIDHHHFLSLVLQCTRLASTIAIPPKKIKFQNSKKKKLPRPLLKKKFSKIVQTLQLRCSNLQ
jgi:hypothetical protein